MAEREAAIVKMDEAVRRSAIKKLDSAVRAVEHDKVALWEAAAECQRTQAYLADDAFLDSEAAARGAAMAAPNDGATRFTTWIEFRYGYKRTMAKQLAQAGRVYELLPENPPANERQMRPLYPLLREEDDQPGIVREYWQAAREAAELEHKPERVARHISRLIEEHGLKPKPTLLQEEEKLEQDIKRTRRLMLSLWDRMDSADFNKRILKWFQAETR